MLRRLNKQYKKTIAQSNWWQYGFLSDSNESSLILDKKTIFKYFRIIIISVFSVVLIITFQRQVANQDLALLATSNNSTSVSQTQASRGSILSQDGSVFADSIKQTGLYIRNGLAKEELDNYLELISSKLGIEYSSLTESVSKNNDNQILLNDNLSNEQVTTFYKEFNDQLDVSLQDIYIRNYNGDYGLAQSIGYVGVDGEKLSKNKVGKSGIELSYEKELAGIPGVLRFTIDSLGKRVKQTLQQSQVTGLNLRLTINSKLQSKAYSIVKEYADRARENGGSGKGVMIVSNAKTGELLSLVNYPSFDSNSFSKENNSEITRLLNDPNKPLFNRATMGLYPPGSTMKPFYGLLGLDEKVIDANTTFVDNGKVEIVNQYDSSIKETFYGHTISGLGPMNLRTAIIKSSDIYFYYLAGGNPTFAGLGGTRITNFLKKLKLDQLVNIGIEENESSIPEIDEYWTQGDSYNIGIGQGDLNLTPISLLRILLGITNNGFIPNLKLVSDVETNDGKVIQKTETKYDGLMNSPNLPQIQQAMREVVTSGMTRLNFDEIIGTSSAGKTGTAETVTSRIPTQDSSLSKPNSWYTGYAPFEDPEIAVVTLFESSGEGSAIAAPATRDFMQYYFNEFKQ